MKQSQFFLLISFMYLSSAITNFWVSFFMGLLFMVFSAISAPKDGK